MRDKIGEKTRLIHIQQAINNIKDFSAGKTADDFASHLMMRFAVERQLEIIGEASNHLSPATKEKAPQTDWRNIKAFRNIAAHEYFSISPVMMHRIVTTDIPELEAVIEALIKNYPD